MNYHTSIQTNEEMKMNKEQIIKLYTEAYESGSHDLKSLNKWLKEWNVKLVGRNGKVINVEAA